MNLGTCFWNLNGVSQLSDDDRRQRTFDSLQTLSEWHEVAIFGLSEIGDEETLEDFAAGLGDSWDYQIAPIQPDRSTLGLLYRADLFGVRSLRSRYLPTYGGDGSLIDLGREHSAFYEVTVRASSRTFLLVVVHLKAEGGRAEMYVRVDLASWLRLVLEDWRKNAVRPIVIGGDFNGGPWEPLFQAGGLRARRRGDDTLRSKDDLQFYALTWRLIHDPEPVERQPSIKLPKGRVGLRSETPTHSYFGSTPGLIDGIVVSGEWLRNDTFRVLEATLKLAIDPLWHSVGSQGAHGTPRRKGECLVSDHLPIVVQLEVK